MNKVKLLPLFEDEKTNEKKRKVVNGSPTNKLVFSAYQGNNGDIFPEILKLYVKKKSIIADVTYGKGAFWKLVPSEIYNVYATDLKTGIDCRNKEISWRTRHR